MAGQRLVNFRSFQNDSVAKTLHHRKYSSHNHIKKRTTRNCLVRCLTITWIWRKPSKQNYDNFANDRTASIIWVWNRSLEGTISSPGADYATNYIAQSMFSNVCVFFLFTTCLVSQNKVRLWFYKSKKRSHIENRTKLTIVFKKIYTKMLLCRYSELHKNYESFLQEISWQKITRKFLQTCNRSRIAFSAVARANKVGGH